MTRREVVQVAEERSNVRRIGARFFVRRLILDTFDIS
jgi:hypothetical protein